MLRAVLQILAALVGVLPRLIEEARAARAASAAARERVAKDDRNAAALRAAQEAVDRSKGGAP